MQDFQASLILSRRDLMKREAFFCSSLGEFFSFAGHALYFPTHGAPEAPELLSAERRLLLPLEWRGESLGVLLLHGVKSRQIRRLLPQLPAIAALCLENLARAVSMKRDPQTGLATELSLLGHMEKEVELVRQAMCDPVHSCSGPLPLHRLCLGMVVLRWLDGEAMSRIQGYAFCEEMMHAQAKACLADLPSDVHAGRLGQYEIALLFPASGRGICRRYAQEALSRILGLSLRDPVTGIALKPKLCAGYALYPQDMLGPELSLLMFDQARKFRDRGRLAADAAERVQAGVNSDLSDPLDAVMSFDHILHEGGVVLECAGLDRLKVSLGKEAKAAEGQRFHVLAAARQGQDSVFKGDIVLLRVGREESLAEIVQLDDPAFPPQMGDRLVLASGQESLLSGEGAGRPEKAPAQAPQINASENDLVSHGEFLRRFVIARESCRTFALAIARFCRPGSASTDNGAEKGSSADMVLESWLQTAALHLREQAARLQAPELSLLGRYGSNSLIVFHPSASAESCRPLYEELCAFAGAFGLSAACGLAAHPFLEFRKDESEACALKALEFALLLETEPRVGLCDSVALNISADRRYSLGDVFGAMEEYKLALLANGRNATARNSLGVCLAALGRAAEARRLVQTALRHAEEPALAAKIAYNLGTICENLADFRAAAHYYRRSAALSPKYRYAWLKLGRLHERRGRRGKARRCYEQAQFLEDAATDGCGAAKRCLARLAGRQRRGAEARELLHDALLLNPDDAQAMLQLAELYLECGEDPVMAEMLVSRSLRLHERRDAWLLLARALRALNREEDARRAEGRALPV